MRRVDVMLLSFPTKNMDYPGLQTPTLSALLKNAGYSVEQRDLNIEIRDKILTAEFLRGLADRVIPNLCRNNVNDAKTYTNLTRFAGLIHRIDSEWSLEEFQRTKELMQRRKYEDVFGDEGRASIVMEIWKVSSALHFLFDVLTFYPRIFHECGVDDVVFETIEDVVAEVREKKPLMVGITVMAIQRKFSLWFAKKLRDHFRGVIAIGGPDPTRFKGAYLREYRCIDFAFVKEVEESLPAFLDELQSGKGDWSRVPGLVYRSGSQVIENEVRSFDPEKVPAPDFSGLPLEKYLLPTLPIHSSRGCYWAKCKFCVHYKTYDRYYKRPVARAVDDIEALVNAYGARYFHFTDDAISASFGMELSEEIIERGLDIRWLTYARLDSNFTRTVLERWYEAGARIIEWGLESAAQSIIDQMQKGIKVTAVQQVLNDAADIGFLNKLFLFHGYPGEKAEDLQVTIDFVKNNVLARKVRPFFPLRNKLELLKGSELFEEAIGADGHKLFTEVWLPSGDFSIGCSYEDIGNYQQKQIKLQKFLLEMQEYMNKNRVFPTNDENMNLDLIISDLKEKGLKLAVQSI
jgi:hypothetical protein